jgi:hypothetical protein
MAVKFHSNIDVLEIFLDVGDISVGPHQIGETRPGSFEGGLYVLQCLTQLRAHVSCADDLAGFVAGKLSRHEDQPTRFNGDDMGVEDEVVDSALVQSLGLNVAAIDRHVS